MKYPHTLIEGRLLRRYKRFLADVELADGQVITAHSANTGSMLGCSTPGSRVWLSVSDNPRRKYAHTWELVEAEPGVLCGINTLLSNKLVQEAIEQGRVAELAGYARIRSEVPYGQERSRIDLLLESDEGLADCYVEVKNVTLVRDGIASFPDAVSARGTKHLRELMSMVAQGQRAVIFFCVQREDAGLMRPAVDIDPLYAKTLAEALANGVEALAYAAQVSVRGVALQRSLPVECG